MTLAAPEEDQWLFTPAQLQQTPSQADGWTYRTELGDRARCIRDLESILLRTQQMDDHRREREGYQPASNLAIGTRPQGKGTLGLAAVLIHRFYMRRSMKDFDTKLISATMLFIASKIEEETVKLRYIANVCLAKFDKREDAQWHPVDQDGNPPAVREYARWEYGILVAEEVIQEALCFDMVVPHPWELATRILPGCDARWGTEEGTTGGGVPGEEVMKDLTWHLIKETLLLPLSVLHPSPIIAAMATAVAFSLRYRKPFSAGLAMTAELLEAGKARIGVDVRFSETSGAEGNDVSRVQACLTDLRDLIKASGISHELALLDEIPVETTATPETGLATHRRQFRFCDTGTKTAATDRTNANVADKIRGDATVNPGSPAGTRGTSDSMKANAGPDDRAETGDVQMTAM